MLNNTQFDEITLDTLNDLIANEVMEGRQLDYKRELNLSTRDERREFLKDVTAFANASGGHLVYGMKEGDDDDTKGFPVEVCGFAPPDGVEQHIAKMENLIRDGIERPLPIYRIKYVPTDSGQPSIVMYVPSSPTKPHWVSLYGLRKFFIRHETVSSPIDFGGLQQLFTLRETISERIRDFRTERVTRLLSGETPVNLASEPALLLHVIPVSSGRSDSEYDLTELFPIPMINPLRFRGIRYNFDGIVTNEDRWGYTQISRNGSIEIADAYAGGSETTEIPSGLFEVSVIRNHLPNAFILQRALGVSPPCYIFLSVLNVRGFKMALPPNEDRSARYEQPVEDESKRVVDRDHLLLSEVEVSDLNPDPTAISVIVHSALNHIWQATGWRESRYYDDEGSWRPR